MDRAVTDANRLVETACTLPGTLNANDLNYEATLQTATPLITLSESSSESGDPATTNDGVDLIGDVTVDLLLHLTCVKRWHLRSAFWPIISQNLPHIAIQRTDRGRTDW